MKKMNFDESSISTLREYSTNNDFQIISTGFIEIDDATGIGGIPVGYITEISGEEGVGKTSLALNIVAQGQKLGLCAIITNSDQFTPQWCNYLGVNIDELFIVSAETLQKAFCIIEMLIQSGLFRVIVIDTIMAMPLQVEVESDMGDNLNSNIPSHYIKDFLRRIIQLLKNKHTAFLMITYPTFEDILEKSIKNKKQSSHTYESQVVSNFASMRFELSKNSLLNNSQVKASIIDIIITKNRFSNPNRHAQFVIEF